MIRVLREIVLGKTVRNDWKLEASGRSQSEKRTGDSSWNDPMQSFDNALGIVI